MNENRKTIRQILEETLPEHLLLLISEVEGVERDGKGIVYRGERFPGFNKPKKYTGSGGKKRRVLAKSGDKVAVVNYGAAGMSDFTKHKDPKRRKNFRSRMNCDPVSKLNKLTPRYWACQDLW